jgi:hypothetical protein
MLRRRRLLAWTTLIVVAVVGSAILVGQSDSSHRGATAAIRDIQVSRNSYIAHVEPSVAVNPQNPLNLLVASQLLGHGRRVIGTYVSLDGGASRQDNGPLRA